jgi:Ca2+-binding EF-hand superfamily protein
LQPNSFTNPTQSYSGSLAKAVFDAADKDKSGHLNKEELLHALKDKMGKKLSEKMLERMVDAQMQLGGTQGFNT